MREDEEEFYRDCGGELREGEEVLGVGQIQRLNFPLKMPTPNQD
ncbi:MAG: hypothetical protein Q8O41_05215 [Candidatus Methanoperedens sp.]|nr:hypothetical protein [Candidatus Methanoperedens sp.]